MAASLTLPVRAGLRHCLLAVSNRASHSFLHYPRVRWTTDNTLCGGLRTRTAAAATMAPMFLEHSGRKVAYHFTPATEASRTAGVVFVHGLFSNMNGGKALALEQLATQLGVAYLRLDYSGHGESSGSVTTTGPGDWLQDVLAALDLVPADLPLVLVGSSCGGWLALHAAQQRPQRVAGLVLVAPAVDFTERRWQMLTDQQRQHLLQHGSVSLSSPYMDSGQDVVGQQFFEQGRQMLLLGGPPPEAAAAGSIQMQCAVHILHSAQDDVVPVAISHALFGALTTQQLSLTVLKDGDHRLSRPQDLELLCGAVQHMLAVLCPDAEP